MMHFNNILGIIQSHRHSHSPVNRLQKYVILQIKLKIVGQGRPRRVLLAMEIAVAGVLQQTRVPCTAALGKKRTREQSNKQRALSFFTWSCKTCSKSKRPREFEKLTQYSPRLRVLGQGVLFHLPAVSNELVMLIVLLLGTSCR